ncbi:MAG: hypothetical protein N3H30_00145 [Candidatus Micrarchaeota archaeon]|nr:hypothetical protein [Candidatus Micrarchaeota archaeon]
MMGIITVESLVCILLLFTALYVFYAALDEISGKSISSLRQSILHDRAGAAQLVVSLHRYCIAHGVSNITIACPLTDRITCQDEAGNAHSATAYTRKGGGN